MFLVTGLSRVTVVYFRPRGRGFNFQSRHYLDGLQTHSISVYNRHQGQLSFPSLRGRYIECRLVWLELKRGAFICVACQLTLCDAM